MVHENKYSFHFLECISSCSWWSLQWLVCVDLCLDFSKEGYVQLKSPSKQKEKVGLGCRFEANCPLVGPGPIGGVLSVGVFLRDPSPYFTWVSKVTTENSERLGRQVRLGLGLNLAPPVFQFRALPLCHWLGGYKSEGSIKMNQWKK